MRSAKNSVGVLHGPKKYRVEWRYVGLEVLWTPTAVTYDGVSLDAAVGNLVDRVQQGPSIKIEWRIVEVQP